MRGEREIQKSMMMMMVMVASIVLLLSFDCGKKRTGELNSITTPEQAD